MQKQLSNLILTARSERAVASQLAANGMTLLAYPLDDGVLVGIGYDGKSGHVVDAELVLRRRGQQMARYGSWLPSMFVDGSYFLVSRLDASDPAQNALDSATLDLAAAQELLA
ncbi:hypothetical protein [Paraherbaspirillum soli]|uniref:Uncharacterized protein n=1 Tax=Paraherbaspirillum soli TaxID=631222 RepID=A0ABW0M7J8_9BURK